jgi:gliding motility-associated-like protein
MFKFFIKIKIVTILLILPMIGKASHIFGGDLVYEHLTGNNYRFYLTIYADCAGSSTLLTNLYSALPIISRYNGNTTVDNFTLSLLPGSGIEVSPVCPAQLSNTTCASPTGTVVGVRQFIYTGTKNLGSTSANWRFIFWGDLNISGNKTGRSNNITNINSTTCGTGGNASIMSLEATLNNVAAPNNSVVLTTLPTPFHCINIAQSYNQGAVDPDGDSLSFELVDGIDGAVANATSYCLVDYIPPYTATNPVSATAGSFSFNTFTGQFNYTPNITQNSLVVIKVTEWRNGIKVGSTMRELTFVVLPSCNNNPPGGSITTTNVGTISGATDIFLCSNASSLLFSIPPIDSNANNINVTYAGLPAGATISITGNNTPAPIINLNYFPTGGYVPGNFTFYITYEDDGCPLTSKQTIAYTIHVLPTPNQAIVSTNATCANGLVGSITVNATGGTPLYNYKLNSGAPQTSNIFSSLASGTYTVSTIDVNGCSKSSIVVITTPPVPTINNIVQTPASCVPGCDGTIVITGTAPAGAGPLQYSSNNGINFQTSNTFTGLCLGTYTVVIKDNNNCTASTIVNIVNPSTPTAIITAPTYASCSPGCDATITGLSAIPTGTYSFSLNSGTYQAANTFSNLCVGNYTITVKDNNGCTGSGTFLVAVPPNPSITGLVNNNASCNPGCDGSITGLASTGVSGGPYSYNLNGGTYTLNNFFNNLCVGTFTITTKDAKGCTANTTVSITTPAGPIISSFTSNNASCVPGCDGGFSNIIASSTAGGLQYSINGTTYQTGNSFSNLCTNNYTIYVKDADGCISSSATNVQTQPTPTISAVATTLASCVPGCDATFTISATGSGIVTLTYNFNGGTYAASNIFNSICKGVYTVNVKDSKGCIASSIVTINQHDNPIIDSQSSTNITCFGYNNGNIYLSASGTGAVAYLLTPTGSANTTGSFNNLIPSAYQVTATDSKGCTVSTNFTITQPSLFAINNFDLRDKTCASQNNGYINITMAGGTQPYTFTLNGGASVDSSNFTQLNAGTYTIIATDNNGCTVSTVAEIDPPINPLTISTQFQSIKCDGSSTDGWAEVFPVAGSQPYSINWNTNPPAFTARVNGLFAGTFIVTVIDNDGCIEMDTVTLTDPSSCCTEIFIPNVFTPNADNINDKVEIRTKTALINTLFQIYDRWGNKVYETTNINEGWNGEYGKLSQEGDLAVYFYLLKYTCKVNDKEYVKKGDLLLAK